MMGQNWQYPYNQGNKPPYFNTLPAYQPLGSYPGAYSGTYPGWTQPTAMPLRQDFYLRQPFPPQPEREQKKQSWYMTAAQEALKIGAIVGASVLGGIFFGPIVGLMAGAVTSGTVSAIGQNASKKKIDWGTVAIDTALGTIPGGVGSTLLKSGQHLLVKTGIRKAAVTGTVDGALMGYAGGTSHSAYNSYQKTGRLNLRQANLNGLRAILPGMLGGAIAGGAFTALGNKFHKAPSTAETLVVQEKQPSKPSAESFKSEQPAPPENGPSEPVNPPKKAVENSPESNSISPVESNTQPHLPTAEAQAQSLITPSTQPAPSVTRPEIPNRRGDIADRSSRQEPSLPKASRQAHLIEGPPQAESHTKPLAASGALSLQAIEARKVPDTSAPSTLARRSQPQNMGSNAGHEVPPPPPPRPKRTLPSTSAQPHPTEIATRSGLSASTPARTVTLQKNSNQIPQTTMLSKPPALPPGKPVMQPRAAAPLPPSPKPTPTELQPAATQQPPSIARLAPPRFQPLFRSDADLTRHYFEQGGIQDCFLLSAIHSALQHRNGAKLLSRIRINALPDGNYQVEFPGMPGQPVTVTQASLTTPPHIKSGSPEIRILEQAYKAMMTQKALRGEIAPLNGRAVLERMFGEAQTSQLLQRYKPENRNTQTLIHDVFNTTIPNEEIVALGIPLRRGDSLQEYKEAVSSLILSNDRLNEQFQAMQIAQADQRVKVTFSTGKEIDMAAQEFAHIQNPEQRQLEIKMQAIMKQYEPQFMDGKPITDFDPFIMNLLGQPGGNELLFERIKINNTDLGTEVIFPTNANSTRKVQLQGQHFTNVEEDRLLIITEAARELEMQTRIDNTMNIGQPEHALRNMFGNRLINAEIHNLHAGNLQAYLREDALFTAVPKADIENHPFTKEHVYSVQPDGNNPNSIIVTDPLNTQSKRFRVPMEEFLTLFEVRGVRFQVNN